MKPSRSLPSKLAVCVVALLCVTACSGGGSASSPTEPPPPPSEPLVLNLSWEADGIGLITGTGSLVAGDKIVLFYDSGGYCVGEGDNEICYPDIGECRSTSWGMIQAYYHDSLSAEDPGTLGQLVPSGCSWAWDWGYYVKCCLVDS